MMKFKYFLFIVTFSLANLASLNQSLAQDPQHQYAKNDDKAALTIIEFDEYLSHSALELAEVYKAHQISDGTLNPATRSQLTETVAQHLAQLTHYIFANDLMAMTYHFYRDQSSIDKIIINNMLPGSFALTVGLTTKSYPVLPYIAYAIAALTIFKGVFSISFQSHLADDLVDHLESDPKFREVFIQEHGAELLMFSPILNQFVTYFLDHLQAVGFKLKGINPAELFQISVRQDYRFKSRLFIYKNLSAMNDSKPNISRSMLFEIDQRIQNQAEKQAVSKIAKLHLKSADKFLQKFIGAIAQNLNNHNQSARTLCELLFNPKQ